MGKKRAKSPAKERAEILAHVRQLLAEHFDCGIVVVSWETEGTTFHSETKFGNEYASKALAGDAINLLWPYNEQEEEEVA